jgi:hypothetical protein
MNHSRDTFLSRISFGDPTAEADSEFLFNRGCFLETDIYALCAKLEAPQFIVGRRGSGKTAMSMVLARLFTNNPAILSSTIIPEPHYFAHAKALARSVATKTEVNWEFLFRSLWATTLRSEWATSLLGYYKLRDSEENDVRILRDYVSLTAPDPRESASERLASYSSCNISLICSSTY